MISAAGLSGPKLVNFTYSHKNNRVGSKQGGLPQEASRTPISLEDETSPVGYEDNVLEELDDSEPQPLYPELGNLAAKSTENLNEKNNHRSSKQGVLPQEASCTPISQEDETLPTTHEKVPNGEDKDLKELDEIELPTGCTLKELTELLLVHDDNNCARFFNYKLQGKPKGQEDASPEPLFSHIKDDLFEVNTIIALQKLHDNFNPQTTEEEPVTHKKTQEEIDFIKACLDTKVMKLAQKWLAENISKIWNDKAKFKELLHNMWFATYPRCQRDRVNGSCAFEHVFLGETKRGIVKGFHNWFFFLTEEKKGNVDYYGFHEAISLSNKGSLIKTTFKWFGMVKPISSLFLGFSPELELAIYTICALQNPNQVDKTTQISLAGETINVHTYLIKGKRGKQYIGSTYPDI